jgi:hypothetical protein
VEDCCFPNADMTLATLSIMVDADLAVFAELRIELWSTPPALSQVC